MSVHDHSSFQTSRQIMNHNDNQAQDSLEKRRKQFDRAKAAHLSRQLQARLQYARLKVDHGWQKQTLNEVENLYFHHYRARLPLRKGTIADNIGVSMAQIPPVAPQLASQLSAVSLVNDVKEVNVSPHDDLDKSTPAGGEILPTNIFENVDETDEMDLDALGEPDDEAEIVEFAPTAGPSTQSVPSVITSPTTLLKAAVVSPSHGSAASAQSGANAVATEMPSWKATPASPSRPSSSTSPLKPHALPSANKIPIPRLPAIPYGTATISRQRSRLQATSRSTFSTPATSCTSAQLTGNPNVALTYDSFWSTHSTSPSAYRSPLLTSTSYPTLDKPGPVTGSPLGTSYSFPLGSSFQQSQLLPRKASTMPSAATSSIQNGPEPG